MFFFQIFCSTYRSYSRQLGFATGEQRRESEFIITNNMYLQLFVEFFCASNKSKNPPNNTKHFFHTIFGNNFTFLNVARKKSV